MAGPRATVAVAVARLNQLLFLLLLQPSSTKQRQWQRQRQQKQQRGAEHCRQTDDNRRRGVCAPVLCMHVHTYRHTQPVHVCVCLALPHSVCLCVRVRVCVRLVLVAALLCAGVELIFSYAGPTDGLADRQTTDDASDTMDRRGRNPEPRRRLLALPPGTAQARSDD